MTVPRLLLVTRRFWPLLGGAEALMGRMAAELRREGAQPTIVTARWQPDWPAEIVHRSVPVVRLPNPALRGWGTLRYMLALGRYLRSHTARFDLVYVSMLKHDAYTALMSRGRSGWPVVLRAEGGGASGDCAWQATANFGRRIGRTCQTADAIVAPSPAIRDELFAAGYSPSRVHLIANGVAVPDAPIDDTRRQAARAALAEANPALNLPSGARLAVFTGRLAAEKGLSTLVSAWKILTVNRRDARLWLVGEGPLAETLETQIAAAGLADRVVLAGAFDEVDELLRAADLFVLPSREEGLSLALLEAMAAGLPVVATDIAGNRLAIDHGRHGLLVPVDDPAALSAAIGTLLGDPAHAARLAAAARDRVRSEFSLAKMVREHLELFQRLVVLRG